MVAKMMPSAVPVLPARRQPRKLLLDDLKIGGSEPDIRL
jgi:hypothetical protein